MVLENDIPTGLNWFPTSSVKEPIRKTAIPTSSATSSEGGTLHYRFLTTGCNSSRDAPSQLVGIGGSVVVAYSFWELK